MSVTGTRLTMISMYTLQRFAHFSPQDSISSVEFLALHDVLETDDRDTAFRSINSLFWVDSTTYFPLHLLAYH